MRKIPILLLCLCLAVLSACTGDTSMSNPLSQSQTVAEVSMGRYVEEQWALPDGVNEFYAITRRGDGHILLLNYWGDEHELYSTTDGETWQRETPAWLAWCEERGYVVRNISCNTAGDLAVGYSDIQGSGPEQGVMIVKTSDEIVELPLDLKAATKATDGSFTFAPQRMVLGDNGYLYITGNFKGTISVFAEDGSFLYNQLHDGAVVAAAGEYFVQATDASASGLTADSNQSSIALYSIGQTASQPEIIPCEQINQRKDVLAASPDGSIYLLNSSGIYRRTLGGSVWAKLLDGSLTTLGLNLGSKALILHGEDEFLVAQDSALYNYRYDPTVPTVPSAELTVYTFFERSSLQWGAYALQKKRPDVAVNVVNRMEDLMNSVARDDAVKTLNTELLAGSGPDLFLLDYMPVDSMIDKGALADLSGVVGPMIDSGELLENIAGTYQRDGKICAIPCRFGVSMVWGDKEAVAACSSLSSIADYAEANGDKQLFWGTELRDVLEWFFYNSYPAWVANETVDKNAIAAFLTDSKRIVDAQSEKAPVDYLYAFPAMAFGKLELYQRNFNGFQHIWEPNSAVAARYGVVINGESEERITSLPRAEVQECYAVLPGQVEDVFYDQSVIGVNAASNQQELAMEFVRCMLSADVQNQDLNDGFPILRESWDYHMQKIDSSTGASSFEEQLFVYAQPAAYVYEALLADFQTLKTPVTVDRFRYQEMEPQIQAFLDGACTAEDAADSIASKLQIQLAEAG